MLGVVDAQRYDRLIQDIQAEFPDFRLVRKDDSRFQRAIHYALLVLTFGRMRRYLDSYQTTIGKTVYVTSDWDDWDPRDRFITLSHERVHMRQFQRYTLLGMGLAYLLLPLPMGLAYFRARFEKAAYEVSIRTAAAVYGIDYVRDQEYREELIGQFLGPSYGWMWPFRRSMEAWYERVLASLEPPSRQSGDGAGDRE